MAEKYNITWKITYKVKDNVTSPARLHLQSSELKHGKWIDEPPNTVQVNKAGGSTTIEFKASGRAWVPRGTEGTVKYQGDDPDQTVITIWFTVPVFNENQGSITGGNSYFIISDVNVPKGEDSITATGKITQVRPVI